ncbi:MAG: 2-oxo acid dehydrogenase subunit E2, partial [Steroidobacteraceae bacterium]|nr:2-oxo acid dehydrogenase subunit E2 [Steroidobacteraceae bacterium]
MTEGTVAGWKRQLGEAVEKGSELLDVETEKIVNVVEAPASGVLRRILAETGAVRPVGALLGVLAPAELPDSDIDAFIANFRSAAQSTAEAAAPAAAAGNTDESPVEVRISPIARRRAAQLGIDINTVRGTGPHGRISKEDVEAHAARLSGATAPQRVRLAPTRLTIARRLVESVQTIPQYRLSVRAEVDALLKWRAALASGATSRISVNVLILRACALALPRHPMLNAQLRDDELLQFPHADISIAVATPNGLVAPVVRGADRLSIAELATASAALIERARRGALSRADLDGGSFTVSNLGMFGVPAFDAIVNPPQVGILAVGAIEQRPVARAG